MDGPEIRHKMIGLFHRMGRLNAAVDFAELPKSEFVVLEAVERYREIHPEQPGMQVSLLVESLKNAPSSVSRTLRRLEEKGFIERNVDRADRRNVYVSITEAGIRQRDEVRRCLECFADRVIEQMGAEDMERLLVLWERFVTTALRESSMMCERRRQDNDEDHEVSQRV